VSVLPEKGEQQVKKHQGAIINMRLALVEERFQRNILVGDGDE